MRLGREVGRTKGPYPLDLCASVLVHILTSASLARTYSRNLNRYHLSFVPETFIFILIEHELIGLRLLSVPEILFELF